MCFVGMMMQLIESHKVSDKELKSRLTFWEPKDKPTGKQHSIAACSWTLIAIIRDVKPKF